MIATDMGWATSRRWWLRFLPAAFVPALSAVAQISDPQTPSAKDPLKFPGEDDDHRMPDGRSQKNAIAKSQHEQALKDADDLCDTANSLRDQLKKAGDYVVSVDAVKKTEEIEKLAKRIRGRLKY